MPLVFHARVCYGREAGGSVTAGYVRTLGYRDVHDIFRGKEGVFGTSHEHRRNPGRGGFEWAVIAAESGPDSYAGEAVVVEVGYLTE